MANLVAPSFMKMSARRGLALHAEGESGDGLKPATVGDARKMVEGQALSEDKWRRIAPWIARHISDLDAVQGDEITAGLVAMLLWGGGSSKESARRTQSYAERIVAQLDAAEERAPAPKKDQIKGSDTNPAGSAKDKTGGITVSEETQTGLRNKLVEHNEKMKDRPIWTRTTLGALKAVYRRGAGAFSGSHRPGIGRQQWSMARVNAFLYLCRVGRPKNPKYITDNDLLNKAHPKYSGKRKRSEQTLGQLSTRLPATMLNDTVPSKRYDPDQPREDDGKFGEGGGGGGSNEEPASARMPSKGEINGDKPGSSSGNKVSKYDQETDSSEEALAHTEMGIDRAGSLVDSEVDSGRDFSSDDKQRLQSARETLDSADVDRDEINYKEPRDEESNSNKFDATQSKVLGVGKMLQSADDEQLQNLSKVITKIGKNMPNGLGGTKPPNGRHWVSVGNEKRSIAYTNLELRALDDGNTLVGYAAVFDSPSEPMPYTELVRRGAFSKTLNDGADVRLLIDHEGVPLARTRSGTLALEEDERGLRVEAELDPANPDAARVLSAMRRGDLSQMSFAFKTIKDSYNEDRSVRELKEVKLFDVSIVTFPAYEDTVAELRSRNETASVTVASTILIRKNQVLIAKHKQP